MAPDPPPSPVPGTQTEKHRIPSTSPATTQTAAPRPHAIADRFTLANTIVNVHSLRFGGVTGNGYISIEFGVETLDAVKKGICGFHHRKLPGLYPVVNLLDRQGMDRVSLGHGFSVRAALFWYLG